MSETMHIQTDLDSVLSRQEKAEIDAELAHIPYKSGAAIDALKIVQAKRRWVSDECLQAIARYLEMSAEDLEGVATFYNLIYRRPVGENVILLCDSVSCWICGCEQLKAKLSNTLGIDYGETTADGLYTLLPVPCLGACDRAPVMMIEEQLLTGVDDNTLQQLFSNRGDS